MANNVENNNRQLDWSYIVLFWCLVFTITATAVSYFKGWVLRENTPTIHFLVLLESVSVVITGLFIWATVNEGRINRNALTSETRLDRQLLRIENQKERRKERLREQLKFYSPIVGKIRHESYEVEWKRNIIRELLEGVQDMYELYSEPRTKRLLREYFQGQVKFMTEYTDFSQKLRVIILEDFGSLRDEYSSLMEESGI